MRTSIESARGCGYRKPGGLYLVAPRLSEACPLLPLPLDRCPHCGQGFGPARGFTWITPGVLFPAKIHGSPVHNEFCPLGRPAIDYRVSPELPKGWHRTGDRAGLIWVGEKFYKTPADFMAEAASMGVSRRISALPRGFQTGRDWVYLGHRKAIDETATLAQFLANEMHEPVSVSGERSYAPGVITLFKPTAVEYIVKGDETDEEIDALQKRGITPVRVIRDIDAKSYGGALIDPAIEIGASNSAVVLL